MKKILSVLVAGTILATAAAPATAQDRGHRGGFSRSHDNRHDNTGAFVALGLGLFALGAIIASQDRHQPREDYGQRRYDYDQGFNSGYNRGYGNGYRDNDDYNRDAGYSSGYNNGYSNGYGNAYGYNR